MNCSHRFSTHGQGCQGAGCTVHVHKLEAYLVAKVASANDVLMRIINQKVEELDAERQALSLENISMNSVRAQDSFSTILNHVSQWEDTSIQERERVVDAFIEKITIADGKMDIAWNI